jgi:hypothetical protein
VAVEQNVVHPGEPTLTGWLTVLLQEVIDLREAEEKRASHPVSFADRVEALNREMDELQARMKKLREPPSQTER